jgi:hypothetical protein
MRRLITPDGAEGPSAHSSWPASFQIRRSLMRVMTPGGLRREASSPRPQHLVAWDKVCKPTDLGGLNISNLRLFGWALRVRWLWLKKTEPHHPWASLDIQVAGPVQAFFRIAISSEVENGEGTLF